MNIPHIAVNENVIIGLAVLALLTCWVVYRENKRLTQQIESKKPCRCHGQTENIEVKDNAE